MTWTRCTAPNVVLEAIQSAVCASRHNLTASELSWSLAPRQRAPFSCQKGAPEPGPRSREIGSPARSQDAARQLEDFSEMTLGLLAALGMPLPSLAQDASYSLSSSFDFPDHDRTGNARPSGRIMRACDRFQAHFSPRRRGSFFSPPPPPLGGRCAWC